jgi:tetratricopeptide (TPR) repeat protein
LVQYPKRLKSLVVLLLTMGLAGAALGLRLTSRFDLQGKAQLAFLNRDYRTALRAAQDHLKRWPGDRRASLMAARCLGCMGLPRQAEVYYQQAGELDLDDLQDRAYGLVRAGDPHRAAEVYFKLITRWPDNVLALKRLAAVLMELKQWKSALLLSERLLRIPSGQVAGHTLAGIGFHVSKHAAQAAESFERVLQLDPELKEMPLPHDLFWNHLALDLIALGRTNAARGYLQQALARREDAGLRELLGVTYEKEGLLSQAEQCWRQALSRDPNNTDALLDLGRLALSRRQWSEAVRLLERARVLSPQSVDPVYNLSRAYRLKGDIASAERCEALAARLRTSQQRGDVGQMPARADLLTSPVGPGQESVR